MNPLYLSDVLQNIFSHLTPDELYPMRLICTDWEIAARVEIRKRCLVTFKSLQDVQTYIKIFTDNANSSLHTHFHFSFSNSETTPGKTVMCEEFFPKFGTFIKTLHVDTPDFFNQYTQSLEKYCPGLEELHFSVPRNIESGKTPGTFSSTFPIRCSNIKVLVVPSCFNPSFLKEVSQSQSMQKLEQIYVGTKYSAVPISGECYVEFIKAICSAPNLQVIEVLFCLTDKCWLTLAESGLRLQVLKASVSPDVEQSSLRKFLESQKNSLIKLKTTHSSLSHVSFRPEAFPLMPALKSLSIAYNAGRFSQLISKIPNICFLELKNYCPYWEDFTPDVDSAEPNEQEKIIAPYAKTLQIRTSRQFNLQLELVSFAPGLAKLGRMFPSLEKFYFGIRDLRDMEFQTIIKGMKNLRVLYLYQAEELEVFDFSDDCFTGIRASDGEPCPSIQDLKNLESLSLTESTNMTDAAVVDGLAKCIQLKSLKLHSRVFTDHAIEALANLKELEKLNLGFHYGLVTQKAVEYLMQEIPRAKVDLALLPRERI